MKEIEYVKKSEKRVNVLKSLDGEVKIPSEIAEDAQILQNHISKTLRQLREHGLIECINPEAKRGRLYRLTDKGKRIMGDLNG
ncbi:winged helix DNA-binding protein [Methanobrevibacter sp.]